MRERIALVTGAGKGIGQAIALELASRGYTVYANARSEEKVRETIEKGRCMGFKMIPLIFDVSKEKEVKEQISSIPHIDCLVNNAGISLNRKFEDLTEEDWDITINTNVKGYYLLKVCFGKNDKGRSYSKYVIWCCKNRW